MRTGSPAQREEGVRNKSAASTAFKRSGRVPEAPDGSHLVVLFDDGHQAPVEDESSLQEAGGGQCGPGFALI